MYPNIVNVQNAGDGTIMISSNIQLTEGRRPARIVLRSIEKEFIIQTEFFYVRTEDKLTRGEMCTYITCVHDEYGDAIELFKYDEKDAKSQAAARAEAYEYFFARCRPVVLW